MEGKLVILKDIFDNDYIGIIIENHPELNRIVLEKLKVFKSSKENADALIEKQQTRDRGHRHITVFNPMECQKDSSLLMLDSAVVDDIEILNIGSINMEKDSELLETFYILVTSQSIQDLRAAYNLKEKDLHITIGFTHKDLFHKPKNLSTII